MASQDMVERIRAERELSQLNESAGAPRRRSHGATEKTNQASRPRSRVRHRVEKALRESHERTSAVFETASGRHHQHGCREAGSSNSTRRPSGYSGIRGRRDRADAGHTIVPPALRERHRRRARALSCERRSNAVGQPHRSPGLRADGTLVDLELAINRMPGDGPPMFAAFVRDISERTRAAEKLKESQARFQTLAESLPHLVWTCDPDGWCDYPEPAVGRIHRAP